MTIALYGAGLSSFAAMYCTQALLPALSASYRITPATAALTVSLTTGMLALSIIPASVLSERYGRITVMLTSGIASSVIGLLLPLSPTLGVLLAGRALHGVALAGIPAVAMAFLAEEVHASSLGSAMGAATSRAPRWEGWSGGSCRPWSSTSAIGGSRCWCAR